MAAKYAVSSHVGKHERKYPYSKLQNTIAQLCSMFFLFETNLIDFSEKCDLKD